MASSDRATQVGLKLFSDMAIIPGGPFGPQPELMLYSGLNLYSSCSVAWQPNQAAQCGLKLH